MANLVKQSQLLRMISEKKSRVEIIRAVGSLSFEKAVDPANPSIGSLQRYWKQSKGIDKAAAVRQSENYVSVLIQDLSQSFENELEPDQIQEISAEICNTIHRNLSLEEIYYVCKQLRTEKVYGKLTVNKVLNRFQNHFEQRLDHAERVNLSQHLSKKESRANTKTERQKNREAQAEYLKTVTFEKPKK